MPANTTNYRTGKKPQMALLAMQRSEMAKNGGAKNKPPNRQHGLTYGTCSAAPGYVLGPKEDATKRCAKSGLGSSVPRVADATATYSGCRRLSMVVCKARVEQGRNEAVDSRCEAYSSETWASPVVIWAERKAPGKELRGATQESAAPQQQGRPRRQGMPLLPSPDFSAARGAPQ